MTVRDSGCSVWSSCSSSGGCALLNKAVVRSRKEDGLGDAGRATACCSLSPSPSLSYFRFVFPSQLRLSEFTYQAVQPMTAHSSHQPTHPPHHHPLPPLRSLLRLLMQPDGGLWLGCVWLLLCALRSFVVPVVLSFRLESFCSLGIDN